MQYSNLKNEEVTEDKLEEVGEVNVDVRKGMKKPQDFLVKKEAYWFMAMVLTFLLIGSVVFYVTHSGGNIPLIVCFKTDVLKIPTTPKVLTCKPPPFLQSLQPSQLEVR